MTSEPHLHWSFNNEHVLFPSLVLSSFGNFLVASSVVVVICISERLFSYSLDKDWTPRRLRYRRLSAALWRTGLYSLTTFLRLCYMLIAMSSHLGLISMTVITLSFCQFFIELQKQPKSSLSLPRNMDDTTRHIRGSVMQPLLEEVGEQRQNPLKLKSIQTRPRSKSKPDAIFIHPAESNIARADAVALELGLGGETDLVSGHSYVKEESAWEIGKGKDLAREILLGGKKKSPTREPFDIGNESDSD